MLAAGLLPDGKALSKYSERPVVNAPNYAPAVDQGGEPGKTDPKKNNGTNTYRRAEDCPCGTVQQLLRRQGHKALAECK